jgi:hypothetical protein
MMDHVMVPVAVAELYDKISILEIKMERIEDATKLCNVTSELGLLNKIAVTLDCSKSQEVTALRQELKSINVVIWDTENSVRQVMKEDGSGEVFASVARHTYLNNDRRAAIKRKINLLSGSLIIEEKSHSIRTPIPADPSRVT